MTFTYVTSCCYTRKTTKILRKSSKRGCLILIAYSISQTCFASNASNPGRNIWKMRCNVDAKVVTFNRARFRKLTAILSLKDHHLPLLSDKTADPGLGRSPRWRFCVFYVVNNSVYYSSRIYQRITMYKILNFSYI